MPFFSHVGVASSSRWSSASAPAACATSSTRPRRPRRRSSSSTSSTRSAAARRRRRRLGGHDEREQTLNQILTEMDGFTGTRGRHRPGRRRTARTSSTPALLRPGRFDRRVTVNPPDLEGRRQILEVHTRSVPLGRRRRPRRVASTTPGMVGADLRNLVNEAALLAARRDHDAVSRADFYDAFEKIVLGAERRITLSAGGARAHRLPRGRPRAAGHARAGRRPGPQGLDRPARPRAGRDLPVARERPLRLRHRLPAGPHRRRARRPRRRGDRLRQRHHRRRVRPRAGHRASPARWSAAGA